jgi:hypothetical protein
MANKANPKDIIPLREALNMEIMINQALIDLLVAKGIICYVVSPSSRKVVPVDSSMARGKCSFLSEIG